MARTQRRLAAVLTRSLVLAVCWCLCPSPIPCCLYCGIGPCAQVPKFKKESDTKWVGTGESQLAGGCCTMCCHNEGDTMMIEGDKLVWSVGKSPAYPPCLQGKRVAEVSIAVASKAVTPAGGPGALEMAR